MSDSQHRWKTTRPSSPPRMPPNNRILVAVDFGTTFTGVAWVDTAQPEVRSLITPWPSSPGSSHHSTNDKVPTEIAYHGSEIKWGSAIPDSALRHQCFKLDLNTAPHDELSTLAQDFPNPKAASKEDGKDAEKLTVDYLDAIRLHILDTLELEIGKTVIDNRLIAFVTTVPATWTDPARHNARRCVELAGMGQDLPMISEPEAAILYTMDATNSEHLAVGNALVVCDAGGRTVDLISYHVDETTPELKVSEAASGSSHTCGSVFLNRIFRKWLEENLSGNPGWSEDAAQEAVQAFDRTVKRDFDGSDTTHMIPVPGFLDDKMAGVKRGEISLHASTLREIFRVVVTKICGLVEAQIEKTPKSVQAILLVGGLGQNPYLRNQVASVVDERIEILQPACGSTAVVRGALIHGLAKTLQRDLYGVARSRVSRGAVGWQFESVFRNATDPPEHKYCDSRTGFYYIMKMDWVVRTGDTLRDSMPRSDEFHHFSLVSDGPPSTVIVKIYSSSALDSQLPVYNNSGQTQIAELSANISGIPSSTFRRRTDLNANDYYDFHYKIRVAFHSAAMSFTLWHKNRCYGAVDVEYPKQDASELSLRQAQEVWEREVMADPPRPPLGYWEPGSEIP